MEYKFVFAFLCVSMIYLCSAEFTADIVYEILSSKVDVLLLTLKGMRNEINDISEKVETSESETSKEQCAEVKALFESLKAEMNDRFENLESKITKKVEDLVQEALVSTRKESDKLKSNINGVRKFVSSEKVALRKLNDQFENDTRKNINNITDAFEGRIQNMEQVIALFTNSSKTRIVEVENKMFAFENASWKGERGEVGPVGQKGQRGITGEKGVTGIKGSKGEVGVGNKGQRGQFGIKGEKGDTGIKGNKGERGISLKGQKGERGYKGQPESRHSVYFHVSMTGSTEKTISENTVVKFDHVLTNTGNGYSSSTGIFTAPYSGAYLFLFFVRPGADKYDIAYFELYVDGDFRAYALQQSVQDSHNTLGGQAYVEYMNTGEKAWIQTGDITGGSIHTVHSAGVTFTGVLIN